MGDGPLRGKHVVGTEQGGRYDLFPLFLVINVIIYCIVMITVSDMRSTVCCSASDRLLIHCLFLVFLTDALRQI